VFSSRDECASDHDCADVARALETDFTRHDVIVASTVQMGITYSLGDSPTTLGDEWRIYQGLHPRCQIGGRDSKVLEARTDAGGGRVVYAATAPKLAEHAHVSCTCE
jgi:hypothetical protein